MKKWGVLLVVCLFTLTMVLAGCAKKNENANESPQDSTDAAPSASAATSSEQSEKEITGKLTFLTWETNIVDTKLKDMADQFMAEYPGVELKIEGFSDAQAIKIRAAANDLPDIVNVADGHLGRDQLSKFFIPVNDLPVAGQLLGLDSLVAPDGKNYTLPRGLMIQPVVWYNKAIFAELGLDIPKTYSEFLAVCQKIKDSGKYYPLSSGAKDGWPLDNYQQLAPILDNDLNVYNSFAEKDEPFTPDSGYVKSFTILKEFLDKGYFEKDPLSVGFDAATNELGTGKSAMMLMGTWLYQNMSEKGINMENFAIFPFPYSDTPIDTATLIAYPDLPMAINKDTKSMDAARAFVDWYFNKYDQTFMQYSGMLSSRKDADNSTIAWAGFLKDFKVSISPLKPQQEQAIKVWSNSGISLFKSMQELFAGKSVADITKDLNAQFKKGRDLTK